MRIRFLNNDYFALENRSFLRLPVPQLPVKPFSALGDLHFDTLPEISIGIEKLTIDSALSKFFDDVLPHRIDDDIRCFHACGHSSKCQGYEESIFSPESVESQWLEETAIVLYEDNEDKSWKNFRSASSEIESINKDNGTDIRDGKQQIFQIVQFETPQLDVLMENTFLSEKGEAQIFTVFPEVECNFENLDQGLLTYSSKVEESIYAVEGITLDYLKDKESCLLDKDDSDQCKKLLHQTTFPHLEVDEMFLETLAGPSLEDEFLFLLENTSSASLYGQNDKLLLNSEEYLCFIKCDNEKLVSNNFLSPRSDSELVSLDTSRGSNLLMEFLETAVNTVIQTKSSSDLSRELALLEEIQMLDVYMNQPFEVYVDKEISIILEICDSMFCEKMKLKNFNELVVCHELALADDTFKSLPVPILSNQGTFSSLYASIEETLANLNEQPPFASDGIYLDWHLLEENNCNSKIYSSNQNMMEEIKLQPVKFDQEPCENGSVFYGYVFSDDASVAERTDESGEPKEPFTDGILKFSDQTAEVSSSILLTGRSAQKVSQDLAAVVEDGEKASLSWKSILESNDLDFFLHSQKPLAGQSSMTTDVKKSESVSSATDTCIMFPKVSCIEPLTGQSSMSGGGVTLKQCDVTLNQVYLSDSILNLISNSEKSYMAILQNETELRKTYLSYVADDHFIMLSLPKQKLIDCIRRIYLRGTTTYWEEKIMTLATLYAIKQIGWYLCFYGIQPAYLYLTKLCQRLEGLKSRLGLLVSLIEDANRTVDKDITKSHPALATVHELLSSKTAISTLKVLVVANQIFWWSLKKLFVSMGLSFEELSYETRDQQISNPNFMVDDLPDSNCILASQEYISACFPFNKFSIILEYGGPNGSSQISSHLSKLVDLPHLHFVMLELINSGNCKAFCEGADVQQHDELTIEKSLVENKSKMLEILLNFLPIEEKYNLASVEDAIEVEDGHMPLRVPVIPLADESNRIDQTVVSSPVAIVIVNTQNFGKEMIVSRRSSYQKILVLEKEGIQVVERDLSFPVDLIISSAVCLIWYDCTNIRGKDSSSGGASFCLSSCIETIATDVLTSLSFTFTGCVLVFEGEMNFLSSVMELSDGLYAAASSLEIYLQLFCSYSSELTDEIILGCIEYISKLTRGLYPKMSESETLAESFLTSFPSINPLTAHGILSSECTLIEFLEGPHERRLHAIRKYLVPDESVSLFSALCKYGEREDSKSAMTDCSSSVSSGPDSENCQFNVRSKRKRKFSGGTLCTDKSKDLFIFDPLKSYTIVQPSSVSMASGSQMFKDPEIFCDHRRPSSSLNHFFNQNHNLDFLDAAMMVDPSSIRKPCDDTWIARAPEISDEMTRICSSLDEKPNVQNQGLSSNKKKLQNWHNMSKSENQYEDLIGEVINLVDRPVVKDSFATMDTLNFLPSFLDDEKDSSRKCKAQRGLLYGHSGHPISAVDIMNSSSEIWSSLKMHGQSSQGFSNDYHNSHFITSTTPLKDGLSNECLMQNSVRNSKVSPLSEDVSRSDATPLSNALRSNHLQDSSPWTIEFLNRIREKSRLCRQSLPSGSSSPFPEYLGSVRKTVKRRSPSILEFFKYQGGSTLRKKPEQKKQKQSTKTLNTSQNGLVSTRPLSSWTPIDKRSRQTLSFATDGNGSQTKLVWSDDNDGRGKSVRKFNK